MSCPKAQLLLVWQKQVLLFIVFSTMAASVGDIVCADTLLKAVRGSWQLDAGTYSEDAVWLEKGTSCTFWETFLGKLAAKFSVFFCYMLG